MVHGQDVLREPTARGPPCESAEVGSAAPVVPMDGWGHTAIVAKWSGGLEPAEEKLLSCAESGEQYYPGPAPAHRPMEDWGPGRTVRAQMLRHLLVEQEWPVHSKGVVMRKVRVTGLLDLEAATVRCPVRLKECYFDAEKPAVLDLATVPVLEILECHLAGMTAGWLVVTKRLDLSMSTFTGPVQLSDADITGGLYCHGATLKGKDSAGYALCGSRMKVSGGVFLTDFQWRSSGELRTQPFSAAGAIILDDGDIGGGLQCDGAHLNGRQADGFALVGYRMKVDGEVTLKNAQISSGGIGLIDANITAALRCGGARLRGRDEGLRSLIGDGIKVGSGAYLSSIHSEGTISLLDAVITGQLDFRGADIAGSGAEVVGSQAEVAGTGKGEGSCSLIADRATVSGGVWLSDGFHAAGAVRLSGTSITGMLSCAGARLDGSDQSGYSLIGQAMAVSGDVHLSTGFQAVGGVDLKSARIGGSLSVMPAKLAGGPSTTALDATAAQIGNELQWEPAAPVCGRVILEDASAGSLKDSWSGAKGVARPNGYWPSADLGQLLLGGFTYGRFGGSQLASLEHRLAWIGSYRRRSAARTGFAPQPYEHLVQVYQQAGHDTEARKVAIARRRDLRWYGNVSGWRRAGNWLLDVTIRYGYETWRALMLLAAVYLIVLTVFLIGQHQPTIVVPAQSVAGLHPVPTAMNCTKGYPCFYPAGYAIDTVIPLINVGQGGYWRPNASAGYGWFFVVVSWAGIAAGWALATLIVAGYTGLARRVDSP